MILRLAVVLMLCGYALGQSQPAWPCRDEIRKTDPNAQFIRVSDRVTNAMAQQKALPDISDIKGKDADALVVVHVIISPQGDVRCSEIQEGDTDLQQRSLDAANKWHYQPYLLNGKPLNVDTWIRFSYRNGGVEVFLPPR